MSLWSKIRGTIEQIFQIGLGGPQLKNNSGDIEARNSTDTDFTVVRGATPVAANDLATKAYVDSASGQTGAAFEIRLPITTAASQSSTTSIPANAFILEARLNITTPYSSGATISVGTSSSPSLFIGASDSLPQTVGIYSISQDTTIGGTPAAVLVTISGSPATGVGAVTVVYSVPNT